MLALLSLVFAQTMTPGLKDVEAKISTLPGVEIVSEMISPSIVPVTFKISPKGSFYSKYPTTEMFVTPTKSLTWMPDRREYSETKSEEGNPLPVGYHTMWPDGSKTYRQTGETKSATFNGFDCWQIPCKGKDDYTINLYVEKSTLLTRGTKVELNGTLYEMVHRKITVGTVAPAELTFQKPKDARPAGKFDPAESLIKPGTKLSSFSAKDTSGKSISFKDLLSKHKGVVFNFWFSSCTGCVAEMPYLVKLSPNLAKSKIALIGVNAVDGRDIAARTAKKNKLPFPTLTGSGAETLTKAVSVQAYPVTLIVNKQGIVLDAIMGFDETRLKAAIDKI